MKRPFIVCLALLSLAGCIKPDRVGPVGENRHLTATGQYLEPAGDLITFAGRPVDLCFSADGKLVFAKDDSDLVVIDRRTREVVQQLPIPGGASGHGIAAAGVGVWVSTSKSTLQYAEIADGKWAWARKIDLPKPDVGGDVYPMGIQVVGSSLWVAASRSNLVLEIDAASGKVTRTFPVDVAPYDALVEGNTLYVSCWGGAPPEAWDNSLKSSGSPVKVDSRGVAANGSVLRIDLATGEKTRALTSLQPMQLLLQTPKKRLFVAHGNADIVTVLDPSSMKISSKIETKQDKRLPFGAMPNAIALSADGNTLYAANGGTNSIAVIDTDKRATRGFIPTGWYPGALALEKGELWIANVKGVGSREARPGGEFSVYNASGLIQRLSEPSRGELEKMTEVAKRCSGATDALAALERSKSKGTEAIPSKLGVTSPIEHVVYILKENRTYDQVLGDVKEGDGDPKLCIFGEKVTPNHHALAREFVLLDNYYCNGVNSADGHSWAMEGAVTGYLEKSFGGFTRSYPYGGDDAINAAESGFIWDAFLARGLSFQNFGEFDNATTVPKRSWTELYAEHKAGVRKTTFTKSIDLERIRPYTDQEYPGWQMGIPEQIRADIFLERFAEQKSMANLTIIYLPQDHTSGTGEGVPTPRAHVADNDLAVGRIVEALSNSKYWPKMAIFILEDDPQNGFDHIDGHRSFCLVASPYAKRGATLSNFYNQTSVLHTMLRIFGMGPINQFVALSPVMKECFTDKPDLTPYKCRPAEIALDEMNPPKDKQNDLQRRMAALSAKQDLTKMDAIDDDAFNRIIWHSVKGALPYPADWAGAHGRGLKKKGLVVDKNVKDEDDEEEEEEE